MKLVDHEYKYYPWPVFAQAPHFLSGGGGCCAFFRIIRYSLCSIITPRDRNETLKMMEIVVRDGMRVVY